MQHKAATFLEQFASCLDPPPNGLNLESVLTDLEGFDSLAKLSVVSMVEAEYEVVLVDSVFSKYKTVGELHDHVVRLVTSYFG